MLILGLVDVPVWLLLSVFIIVTLLIYGSWNFNFFKSQGIPGPTAYPFIGTIEGSFFRGVSTGDVELRKKYGKIVGTFSGRTPELVVYDEEMLAQIMVKDFANFTNRRSFFSGDEVMDTMLTIIRDNHWRHVRNNMSPTFSTGKLKKMMSEINRCGQQLAKNLAKEAQTGKQFDIREYAGAFTMDVIASTAFGMRVNSQTDTDNLFVKKARKALSKFTDTSPVLIIMMVFPWVIPYLRRFGITFIDEDVIAFFTDVTRQALEIRRQDEDQSRTDFIQLMVRAQQGHSIIDPESPEDQDREQTKVDGGGDEKVDETKLKGLTTNEILGNAFLFFLAGFDTTAVTLTMLFYSLAVNQEVQDRLLEEIDDVCGKEEPVKYESLSKLVYLDQCICESLRMYPVAFRLERVAGRDVTVGGVNLPKDSVVSVPVYGIHHSPDIWPEPEKFDPERFAPERKGEHSPYHWLPFGFGPRNCIGMRLALMEIKLAVIHALRKHRVVTSESTEIPFKPGKLQILQPGQKCFMKMEPRD